MYYDDSKKLETTSNGALCTGTFNSNNGTVSHSLGNELVITRGSQAISINANNAGANSYSIINTTAPNGVYLAVSGTNVAVARADKFEVYKDLRITADNEKLQIGLHQDLELYHDGTNSVIDNNTGRLELSSTGDIILKPGDKKGIICTEDAQVELYYNDFKKLETTTEGAKVTGNLGINVASPDSPLEVGGTGPSLATIHHTDGGTNDEARLMLGALSANPPDQRGAGISARNKGAGHDLEIQTSSTHSAGPSTKVVVTAGGQLQIPNDSGQLQLGASQDLQLYHNGTDSYIDNHQGDLYIRGDGDDIFLKAVDTKDSLRCIPNAAVELYHNDNKKLETTSGGVTVTGSVVCDTNFRGGDNVKLSLGDAQDLEIDHDGTNNDINYSNGNLLIRQGSHSSSQCLQFDGNGHLYVPDNELIYFGSSADLQLYHDGSNSYIKEAGTGNLNIISDNTIEIEKVNGTDIARFHPDGAVELFYDGNKKFETSSNGVRIPDDIYLGLGNSDDLNIRFLNGTGAFIQSGGNNMYIRSNLIELGDNSGNKYIKCVDGAQVELYHGVNSKKLETSSGGGVLTGTWLPASDASGNFGSTSNRWGTVYATSFQGDGSNLTGITSTTINNNAANTLITGSGTANTLNANSFFKVSGGYIQLNNDNGGVSFGTAGVGSFGVVPTIARAEQSGYHVTTSGAGDLCIGAEFQNDILFGTTSSTSGGLAGRLKITAAGHTTPAVNNQNDLGTSGVRWRNVYTNDLNLSNEGSSNDVDGTWGSYTIVEGESDLFLKNNRSGKKYKFNLTEVS